MLKSTAADLGFHMFALQAVSQFDIKPFLPTKNQLD